MKNKFGIIAEFKEFIMRGNVFDLAIGVIIGAAFQAIIKSLVDDIISPLVGFLIGNTDFSHLSIVLKAATLEDGSDAIIFSYGNFITAVVQFLLMAVCIFILVKIINVIKRKSAKKEEETEEAPQTKICSFCKSEINISATRCPHCTSEVE